MIFDFCDPYSSWQRGLNENINGLIRQYIPKGSSFENISKKQIKEIEDKLNHRPRKSLGWKNCTLDLNSGSYNLSAAFL